MALSTIPLTYKYMKPPVYTITVSPLLLKIYFTHYDCLILAFSREISEAFNVLGSDPDCRSIVLSGNGKMFCAGIDLGTLAEMGQVTSEDGDVARKAIQFYKIIRAFQNYFMDIERVSLELVLHNRI